MNPKEKAEAKEEEEKPDPETEAAEEEISPEENEDQSPEIIREQLAETRKKLKAANAESKARREKLEKLEKEEADRKKAELSEVDKAKAEAKEAAEERDRIKQENQELKLEAEFESRAREMKLSFANETARKDAFKALDREEIGEDLSGLEEAIKQVVKERPFLFSKQDQQSINDGSAKGRSTKGSSSQETLSKKRKSSPVSPI